MTDYKAVVVMEEEAERKMQTAVCIYGAMENTLSIQGF
jgi:hypothetical protein